MADGSTEIERLRAALSDRRGIAEKRMFGGVCFMLGDHMLCGASKRGFMFRVGTDSEADALARAGVTRMEMNGRQYPGFVRADPSRCKEAAVRALITLAHDYVAALPPKEKKSKQAAPKKSARGVTPSKAERSKATAKRRAPARKK